MKGLRHSLLAFAGASLLATGLTAADQAKPAAGGATGQAAAAAPARLVPPIRGAATVEYTRPTTKAERINGQQILVTTMQLRNASTGSIAGLKIDEFWYDRAGNPVTGGTFRSKKPLQPNEVITVQIETPRDPNMNSNKYNFSHANGTIVPKLVAKF
jgi:hypothetical protein